MPEQRIFTINELAITYRVSHETVKAAIKRGQIRAVTIGKRVRIPDPGWPIMRYYATNALHREHFIRAQEVMALLNVRKAHLYSMVKRGHLHPVHDENRRWRFSLEDLLQYVNSREVYRQTNPKNGFPRKLTRQRRYDLSRDWLPRNMVIQWARRQAGGNLQLRYSDTMAQEQQPVQQQAVEPQLAPQKAEPVKVQAKAARVPARVHRQNEEQQKPQQ